MGAPPTRLWTSVAIASCHHRLSPPCRYAFGSGVRGSAVLGLLDTLSLSYGVHVIWAPSTSCVTHRLVALAKKLSSGSLNPRTTLQLSTQVLSGKRRSRPDSVEDNSLLMLASLPRCSDVVAKAILARFGSISQLCKASEEEVASVKVGAKSVGPTLARRLLLALGADIDDKPQLSKRAKTQAPKPVINDPSDDD